MSGVPQGSVLGPVLFNIFTNDLHSPIERTLSKFSNDTKLCGAVDMPERWDTIQMDLDKLEKSAHVNLMTFKKTKCKVLHMGRGNPHYQYKLEDEGIESSPEEKDLGVLVDEKLDMSEQCVLAAHGLHQKKHGQQGEGGDSAPLLHSGVTPSGVLRPALEPSAQERHRPVGEGPEQATKMIRGVEHLSYKERLRDLGLFSLKKRRLQGDFIAAFQYLNGAYKKDGGRLFSRACSDRTRGNGFKLREGRFTLGIRKTFFTMSVVKHWNRLPREVIDAPSLETLKVRLARALSNLIQLKMSLLTAGRLD